MDIQYQGIALVSDEMEGPCITFYEDYAKKSFDLDVAEGRQAGDREITGSRWLDSAVSLDEIAERGRALFDEVYNSRK